MPNNSEFEKAVEEIKSMNKEELLSLQFKIENNLRERRLKDVIFYFNNFASKEAVNRHAKAAYEVLCRELRDLRRGYVMDIQLEIIETLIQLD
jgi:hypothetical protein